MATNDKTSKTRNPAAAGNTAKPLGSSSDHGKTGDAGSSAPRNITEAKLRVMVAVPYVRKRGTMTKYKFVRDTDVIAALRGPMIENGLALCGPVDIRNRVLDEIATGNNAKMFRCHAEFKFQLKFMVNGETEDIWAIGEGADSLDKASNKAMSAARKYALILGFNLTSGEDPDQFDEEGKFGGGDHEDDGKGDPEPPKAEKPKPEPKKDKPTANALPANGAELHRRLAEFDAKLAAQKLCALGSLLAHVVAAGVKAGYTADLKEWSGAAIQFAADTAKEFDTAIRQAAPVEAKVTTPTDANGKPDVKPEAPKAAEPPATTPNNDAAKSQAAAKEDAPKAAPAPQAGTVVGPEERFAKRIAGMNASAKVENLDKFREKYAADTEMTAPQRAELELCYWSNVKRIGAATPKK